MIMTHGSLASGCIALAASLSVSLILDWATHDDKPAQAVRLDDRKTWRRPARRVDAQWGALVGAALFIALIGAALAFG
ncbi:hypothetical protein DSM21852_15420 [Methylocystis bryophila]|nr:hypothetical protein DSM21852_15420 [Methylocystis bryophila]